MGKKGKGKGKGGKQDDEEFILSIIFEYVLFPLAVSIACSLLALRDSMHPWPKNIIKDLPKVLLWVVFTISTLFVDNYVTWLVSVFYEQRYEFVPLQDNIMIFKSDILKVMHNLIPGKYLVIICIFCVSSYRQTITNIGFRVFYTISFSRLIRTVAYSLTVLPSRKKNCFKVRMEGQNYIDAIPPRIGGGCNDLVISGHACILGLEYSLIQEFGNSRALTIFALLSSLLDSLNDVFTYQHYSVDMYLGFLLGVFLYQKARLLWPTLEGNISDDDQDKIKFKNDEETLPHVHGKELHWMQRILLLPRKKILMIVSCCWMFFFKLNFPSIALLLTQGVVSAYYSDDKFTIIKHVVVITISHTMSGF